ncbi:MAG: LamG-like jellyroll fold domain-containing protein, partial [Nanoarchaeota archaeon]
DSLVLMFNFDNVSALGEGTSDNITVDLSSYGNNGTIYNMTEVGGNYTTGRYGMGLSFDGVDDYIDIGTIADVDLDLQQGTYAFWFSPVTSISGDSEEQFIVDIGSRVIVGFYLGSVTGLGSTSTNGEISGMYYDGTNQLSTDSGITIWNADQWYHVVYTLDTVNDVQEIYINGELKNTTANSNPVEYVPSRKAGFGAEIINREDYFGGSIDEVRIYNRSLSAEEIQQLYFSNLNKYDKENWSLYVNQTKNTTTVLTEGAYTYQAFAIDNFNNTNSTEIRTVTVDTLPTVHMVNPANNFRTASSSQKLFCNITDTVGITNLTVYVWNQSGNINYTNTTVLSGVSNSTNWTYTFPSSGTFTWNCLGYDTSGSSVWSTEGNYTLIYDLTPPGINFTSPTLDNATTHTERNVEINVSITNADDLNKVIFNWNGTNETTIKVESDNLTANLTISDLTNFTYNNGSSAISLLDDSLVLMMNLDNISELGENSTHIVDLSRYSNNGTWYGGGRSNATAKHGSYSGSFDGSNDYIGLGTSNIIHPGNSAFTASMWFYPTESMSDGDWYFLIRLKQTTQFFFSFYKKTGTSGEIGSVFRGSTQWYTPYDLSSLLNRWNYVVVSYNGGDKSTAASYSVYINGIAIGTGSDNLGAAGGSCNDNAIGSDADASCVSNLGQYTGKIDEVRIWNRSLSATEINLLYLSNLNKYDTDKWQFYINQSTEGNYSILTVGDGNINLNKINSSSYHLYINKSSLLDTTYTYQAFAIDNFNNINSTDIRTISIDATHPKINFTSPTPGSGAVQTKQWFDVNVSITDAADMDKFIYNFNGTNFTIFNDSLVLMMNFDNVSALGENYSNNASGGIKDLSKYGNNGTPGNSTSGSNPSWITTGKYGGAFDFNEDNIQFIDIGDIGDIGTNYTFSVWYNPDKIESDSGFVVSYTSGTLGTANDFVKFYQNKGNISFQVRDNSGSNYVRITAINNLSNGVWKNIVGIRSENNIYIYINGELMDYGSAPFGATTLNKLSVGSSWHDGANNFVSTIDGQIDELRIWNRSLSASEIQILYMSNLRKYDTDKWNFYINQSKNSTVVFSDATVTYKAYAIDNAGNLNSTSQNSISIDASAPTPILNLPVDNNNTVPLTTNITFNCSASDIIGLSNISLYTTLDGSWSLAQTKSLKGASNSTLFSEDPTVTGRFKDSAYSWNCLVYDNAGKSTWSGANQTFSSWNVGNYGNTTYNLSGNFIGLLPNSSGLFENRSGNYTSRVFNATYKASWTNISWDPGFNFYNRELPGNIEDETLCIAENSLITMSDNTKKRIIDIKPGEYVLSLDEEIGKLVSNRVKALLDMGTKPIYELTTASGRSVNTTGNHPYLVRLYSEEECDYYAGDVWNKKYDEFDEYCTRWVRVSELNEDMEVAVPELDQDSNEDIEHYSRDSKNEASSSVPKTLTTGCPLRCGSFDQRSIPNFIANARYGESSGSVISDLALFSCCGEGFSFKLTNLDKITLILSNLSSETPKLEQMASEYLSNDSMIKGWEYISNLYLRNNCLVNDPFFNKEKAIFTSITSSIYDPLCSLCQISFLTNRPSLRQSLSVNLLSLVNSSNSLNSSALLSCSIASCLATSDQLIHENLSIFVFNSSDIVNDTLTIYASPLLNLSNSSKSLTFFLNDLLNISDQFTSGCLSSLSFNSLGSEIVTVGIFDDLHILITLRDYVRILESNKIYKSFDSEEGYVLSEKTKNQIKFEMSDKLSFSEHSQKVIIFDEISSIKQLEPQHVYDLEIENTHNFIANDIIAHNTYSDGVNMSGNVLLMHFNNDSRYDENGTNLSNVYDYSGNGNNGTFIFNNGSSGGNASGKFNRGWYFDGDGDYIEINDSRGLSFTDGSNNDKPFSLSAWVYRLGIGNDDVFFSKDDFGGDGNYDREWQFRMINDGRIGLALYNNTGTNRIQIENSNGDSLVTANAWHHVATTYDGSEADSGLKIYVDGNQISTTTDNSGVYQGMNDTGKSVLVGAGCVNSVCYFNGTIDEVAIWNRTLSAAEILNIYKRGALRLNLSARTCNDPACDGETFQNLGNNHTLTDISSLPNNQYFQYKLNFQTDSINYTPRLSANSITIYYAESPPNITKIYPNITLGESWTNAEMINFSIAESSSQTFNVTFTNLSVARIRWLIDGRNQLSYENLTGFTWAGNYSQEGSYIIAVNVSTAAGYSYQYWNFTVNNTFKNWSEGNG